MGTKRGVSMRYTSTSYRAFWKCLIGIFLFSYAFGGIYRVFRQEQLSIQNKNKTLQIELLAEAGFGTEQLEEVKAFPVAVRAYDKSGVWNIPKLDELTYADSFGAERTYGGKRHHEGVDIIPVNQMIDYYPVVSMTDGTILHVGWLELGGYRVGIQSDSGVYYYYAHLSSYRKGLKEGLRIEAGDLLGFLGDSGYGNEGTRGQFVPHLHLGVYLNGEDDAINPYPLLQYAEKFLFSFYELENR